MRANYPTFYYYYYCCCCYYYDYCCYDSVWMFVCIVFIWREKEKKMKEKRITGSLKCDHIIINSVVFFFYILCFFLFLLVHMPMLLYLLSWNVFVWMSLHFYFIIFYFTNVFAISQHLSIVFGSHFFSFCTFCCCCYCVSDFFFSVHDSNVVVMYNRRHLFVIVGVRLSSFSIFLSH